MDIVSYLIGLLKGVQKGKSSVVIEGSGYTATDAQNNGNVVISKGG